MSIAASDKKLTNNSIPKTKVHIRNIRNINQ